MPESIILEHKNFHHISCKELQYRVTDVGHDVNKACASIETVAQFGTLMKNANDDNMYKSHSKNMFLSHNQLCQRIENYRSRERNSQLSLLNLRKKYDIVNKSLSLHGRLLQILRENNIPRLKEVLNVASRSKRGISYLVGKLMDVVDGLYRANPDQDDKDLALLIQQFGGPALLDMVHRAIGLPSNSTAYRLLRKTPNIKSSLQVSAREIVDNFNFDYDKHPKFSIMLKMDETYVDSRVRWSSKDNMIYGFCHQHTSAANLVFNTEADLETLCDLYDNGSIHMCKESLCLAAASNSAVPKSQFVLTWPSCSKTASSVLKQLTEDISDEFKERNGFPLLNWSSDGDPARRQMFNEIMCYSLSTDHCPDFFDLVKDMALLDLMVGKNGETVDFDVKHLAKRMRNTMISDKWEVNNVVITKGDITKIVSNTDKNTHTISRMVNVKDKQNVPLATDFLLSFNDAVKKISEDPSSCTEMSFRVGSILEELSCFTAVIEGILSIYCYTHLSLESQLRKVSHAAHVLLSMTRSFKVIPNQLYHDLMATFSNVIITAAKYKVYDPMEPLYLFLLGTDPLERLFGNVRVKYGVNSVDHLGLIDAARSLSACQEVLEKHQEWTKKTERYASRLALDYSSTANWDAKKLTTQDIDLYDCFLKGRIDAQNTLKDVNSISTMSKDYSKLSTQKPTVSFLKPLGRLIGLDNSTPDISLGDEDNETEDQEDPEDSDAADTTATSVADFLEDSSTRNDAQVLFKGKYAFKASLLKQCFNGETGSKDRCRRVRGLSRYHDENSAGEQALDNVMLPGDPVLITTMSSQRLCSVSLIKVGVKKVKSLCIDKLQDENIFLEVKSMQCEEKDDKIIWSGIFNLDTTTVPGSKCYAIQPAVDKDSGKFFFSRSLIADIGVTYMLNQPNDVDDGPSSSSDGAKWKCKLCPRTIDVRNMRAHVGKHILFDNLEYRYPCGYCGREGCTVKLLYRDKRKRHSYTPPDSCSYHPGQIRKSTKPSKRVPCLNYVMHCPKCKVDVWSYNLKHHYQDFHPNVEFSSPITQEEMDAMNKSKI